MKLRIQYTYNSSFLILNCLFSMYSLAVSSYIAGILTILAPCVLPILPIILAGGISSGSKWYPYIITLSLAVSVVLFTVALKVSTIFIDIPSSTWKYISGGLLILLSGTYLLPHIWAGIGSRLGMGRSSALLDTA
jgi:cytochrome c biogenesis protein CcdA